MPSPATLHQSLMRQPTGVIGIQPYREIPARMSWSGDVAKAIGRIEVLRREAAEGAPPQQQIGRAGGDLTSSTVIDQALDRYHAGALNAGPPNDQLSKSLHGSLIVDIYTVTGQFMKTISSNTTLRTDRDCALFPLYRELHYAAADAFGRVFGINGDQIDVYLRQQLITMSTHGVAVDTNVGRMMFNNAGGLQVSRLAYLNDEAALACQLHIRNGKFMIANGRGELEPFDCTGPEYRDISKKRGGGFTKTANPARRGNEFNRGHGVAGFAMALNRNIYARKHSNFHAPKGSFYHSCYLEGRELLCTGCITVVQGVLGYINNWSGHYQPSKQQLSLVLQAFRAQGVNIDRVIVEYQRSDGTNNQLWAPTFLESDNVKGVDFVANTKGRFVATAIKIREALKSYEARSKKWWSQPSQNSLLALESLKQIHDDETLVREVRFLLGETLRNGRGAQPTSPINTPRARVLSYGELARQLETAMVFFERY
jgi:hypothetical protein